jgi:hypothetical protein
VMLADVSTRTAVHRASTALRESCMAASLRRRAGAGMWHALIPGSAAPRKGRRGAAQPVPRLTPAEAPE